MRKLTPKEQAELKRGRETFDDMVNDRLEMLPEFMEFVGFAEPEWVLNHADRYLPALDEWLTDQVITEDDRYYLLQCLGYFIGEYFIQRYDGQWDLNDIPDSRFFGHVVVWGFSQLNKPGAMVEPFSVANDLTLMPPGRSLTRMISEVEEALLKA
jgi:hypothetical protein